MRRFGLVLFFLILVAALLLPMGCSQKTDPPPEPGPGDDGDDPIPREEEPGALDPTPGQEVTPPGPVTPPPVRVLTLEGAVLRTVTLPPTARKLDINQQYVYYCLPGAPGNGDFLVDLFGNDYPLPHLAALETPLLRGAVWRGSKLYYLSMDALAQVEDIALYEYNTVTHTAAEHKFTFPEPFRPAFFHVTGDTVFLVGETGTYRYSLREKTLKREVQFELDQETLARASWHPREPLLFYAEGSKLFSLDPLSGNNSLRYQAQGKIEEFFWGDYDLPLILVENRVETLADDGKVLSSRAVLAGARALAQVTNPFASWVMVSYLAPLQEGGPLQLVVEDYENNKRYLYRNCKSYIWDWSGEKIWTYSEGEEEADLTFSYLFWQPEGSKEVEIPYYESREKDPKLPLDYEKGDLVKVAKELFRLRLEEYKRQGSLKKYELNYFSFWGDEPWGFLVAADYSVLPGSGDWVSGNGELAKDGWINNKYNFISVYRDGDSYVLGQNWSTSP